MVDLVVDKRSSIPNKKINETLAYENDRWVNNAFGLNC